MLYDLNLPEGLKKLSIKELEKLAEEIRETIVDVCATNGGHLASNLGVVELTIALIKNTNFSKDSIVWDVGHQSYAYKMLTKRLDKINSIRQKDGLAGFSNMSESDYDHFGTGHSSTSISAGLGISTANKLKGDNENGVVFAVIGDGAMTAGMAFEGINNMSSCTNNLIIILNDNAMSISKNVGGFSQYLSSYFSNLIHGKFFTRIKSETKRLFGNEFVDMMRRIEMSNIAFFTSGIVFESLGLHYIGPVNGHNIKKLDEAIKIAKFQNKACIIHIKTTKGKGYKPAEKQPDEYHGTPKFDKNAGLEKKIKAKTFTDVFANKLISMAKKHKNIVAITAAMPKGTGIAEFKEEFPDRFFDVGIAEQHALTFAAGLASKGIRPYVAIYSTFLQRAYDNIIHDIAIQQLPVTLCIDRGGIVGEDGATHCGFVDMNYLKSVPNFTIMLPKDANELEKMLELSYELNSPCSIRYPKGEAPRYELVDDIVLGEPEIIKSDGDIAIISVGHMYGEVLKALDIIGKKSINAKVINLRFLKPFAAAKMIDVLRDVEHIFTVEDGFVMGGVGDEILSILNKNRVFIPVSKIGIKDLFPSQGSVMEVRNLCGLSGEKIAQTIIRVQNERKIG